MIDINSFNYNKTLFFKNAYELKIRFFYCLFSLFVTILFCYIYSDAIIYLFVNPILIKMSSQRFIFTSLKEIFFMYLKFSFIMGILISIPIFIIQLLFFFINGLYKYEVFYILTFLLLSCFFIYFGFYIGYNILIPNAWSFFLEFENSNDFFPLHFEAKLNNYIFFILNILIIIVLCLQIPAILFLLISFNFIQNLNFLKKRKLIYVFCIILGTFISSPDILSQLFLIIIFLILYEFSIFILIFFKNFKN